MIRFEQDPRGAIEEVIREDVRADMHGDLYGVDRAADAIAVYIEQLHREIAVFKAKLERLEDEINDQSTYI